MEINLVDRWDNESSEGLERYMTYELSDYGKTDVKVKEDGKVVILYSWGYQVYNDKSQGYRDLTDDETEMVVDLAEEQAEAERRISL
jgi:hypothetical protein